MLRPCVESKGRSKPGKTGNWWHGWWMLVVVAFFFCKLRSGGTGSIVPL